MARRIKLSVIVARRDRLVRGGITAVFPRLPAAQGRAHRRRMLCRRSAYRPPSWAAGGLLPPDRAPRRRSGRSRSGCPARRPGHGSWCSVRRASARWLVLVRVFEPAMLVGAHNGAVDHRIFVVGVCGEMLNTLSHTPFLAQRLNRRWTLFRHRTAPADRATASRYDNDRARPRRTTDCPPRSPRPSLRARQQVFDPLPLIVTQSEPPHLGQPPTS